MSKSQRQLLIVAAILAGIQFVILPLMDYQNQQHDELTLLEQRLSRSEQLLQNQEELKELSAAVQANEEKILAAIPMATDKTMMRIELQGEVQSIARKYSVNVDEFNWLTDSQRVSATVDLQRAKIRLEGPVSQLAQTHLEMTQELPSIRFVDASLTSANNRRSKLKGDPQMRLELILEIATRSAVGGEQ